jgi:hypothetical protein
LGAQRRVGARMSESQQDGEYEIVMPFVIVKSHGGQFDDAAFVAGMTCGSIDQELTITAALHTLPRERYLDVRHIPQIDLIAMRHGYQIHLGDLDESGEWQFAEFGWAETELSQPEG